MTLEQKAEALRAAMLAKAKELGLIFAYGTGTEPEPRLKFGAINRQDRAYMAVGLAEAQRPQTSGYASPQPEKHE